MVNKELHSSKSLSSDTEIVIILDFVSTGFLNMHWKFCQGNQGLKDQVMALEWIKDNIQKFGGNPRNVTICGQGSGGSCVNLHLISPLSKGKYPPIIELILILRNSI